jgi:maleylpyruvate isomerase
VTASNRHGITLYGYWRSSSAWRVRIALGFKELTYRYEAVHLLEGGGKQHDAAFKAKNPMEQIPLLEIEDGGELVRIGQSMAIIDYLDARFPEPHKLVPDDPYHAAKARQLAEIVNSGIQPLQNLRVLQAVEELGGDKKAWAMKWIANGLLALEAETRALAGRYSVGDRISIADLFLVPQLYNARRFDVDLAPYPTLARVERACNELPPFHAAHPDRQPDAVA